MRDSRRWPLALCFALAVGCSADSGNDDDDAGRDGRDASGSDVERDVGGGAGLDAGGSDVGGSDAGGSDAGGSDAGGTDGGETDAGTDTGGTDTGGADAGTDAGGTDSGADTSTDTGAAVEICDNGRDDDGDASVDCDDPDCADDPACDATTPPEICDNLIDDDGDRLVDCDDPDCADLPACDDTPTVEICGNGTDDDGDRLVDCDDPDCIGTDGCGGGGGTGSCAEPLRATVGSNTAVPSEDLESPSCLSIDGNEAVFVFTPPSSGAWCLDSRSSVAEDTLVSVRTTCSDVATELVCYDDIDGDDGFDFRAYGTFTASGTSPVYILVDTYNADAGQGVTLAISAGACGGGGTGTGTDFGLIDCDTTAEDQLDGTPAGTEYTVTCPIGCADEIALVYGSDPYTDDSSICRAAVHAGVIVDAVGGDVAVTIAAGEDSYTGTTANGVTTLDWELGWDRSFEVGTP